LIGRRVERNATGDEDRAPIRQNDAEVATVRLGADLGALAPLDGEPRSATPLATDRVTALLGVRRFATLLREFPEVTFELLTGLARDLRCTRDALDEATRTAASG
jgi:CRP-like cAMP-binding protein